MFTLLGLGMLMTGVVLMLGAAPFWGITLFAGGWWVWGRYGKPGDEDGILAALFTLAVIAVAVGATRDWGYLGY